jgi:hypothetical protein
LHNEKGAYEVAPRTYATTPVVVKPLEIPRPGARAEVEAMLDALGWPWSAALSLLLDAAVIEDEAA